MKKNGLVQPLLLAAMLAFGFAAVWEFIGMWAVETGENIMQADMESLSFLRDGTPLVERGNPDQSKARRYSDLEGNSIIPPDSADNAWLLAPCAVPARLPERAARGDVSWEQRLQPNQDGRASPVFWYFVTDGRPDGTAYFVGYDSQSNAHVGYLGTSGFRDGPLPPEELIPFGGAVSGPQSRVLFREFGIQTRRQGGLPGAPRGFVSPWDMYVLGREGKLYHADLQNRTVYVVLEDARLRSATLLEDTSDSARGTLYRLTVRTDDTLLIMDERGEVLRRYPIPEAARERELFVAETSIGEAVMYWKNALDGSPRKVEYHICRTAPDGRSRQARAVLSDDLGFSPVQWGIVLPSPVLLGGYLAFFREPNLQEQGTATYSEALGQALTEFWPALAIIQLLALGFAVLCYRRQVRYGVGRAERIVWPLFVLLLGLPGWIGYRFGRSWPVLETCPACAGVVPRDRGDCAHCAAEFPLPALKGTEVFA